MHISFVPGLHPVRFSSLTSITTLESYIKHKLLLNFGVFMTDLISNAASDVIAM